MKRLGHQEWKDLFSALSILHSDIEPDTLSKRCVAAANKLISAEITAFDFFTDQGVHTGKNWYDPPGVISDAEYEIFAHVAHEHPFSPDVFGKRRSDAIKTADFLTTRKFHQTGIYNEFYKIYSVDHQLLVAFSDATNSIITCTYSRAKSDFSEEERLIVNLIAQHLKIAVRNAHIIERFYKTEMSLNSVLETKSSGMIALNSDNQIVYESEFARRMLEKHFSAGKNVSGLLPESLSEWLNYEIGKFGKNALSPPQAFRVENKDETLEIHLMYNAETREITLLIEEKSKPSPKMLEHLNLTKRETEILFYISQGKANKDVAFLCNISSRTVQKHVENIYTKLGVETRNALMVRALDNLWS
jgi:DNA-binding CsgD family transcriptional regulator